MGTRRLLEVLQVVRARACPRSRRSSSSGESRRASRTISARPSGGRCAPAQHAAPPWGRTGRRGAWACAPAWTGASAQRRTRCTLATGDTSTSAFTRSGCASAKASDTRLPKEEPTSAKRSGSRASGCRQRRRGSTGAACASWACAAAASTGGSAHSGASGAWARTSGPRRPVPAGTARCAPASWLPSGKVKRRTVRPRAPAAARRAARSPAGCPRARGRAGAWRKGGAWREGYPQAWQARSSRRRTVCGHAVAEVMAVGTRGRPRGAAAVARPPRR